MIKRRKNRHVRLSSICNALSQLKVFKNFWTQNFVSINRLTKISGRPLTIWQICSLIEVRKSSAWCYVNSIRGFDILFVSRNIISIKESFFMMEYTTLHLLIMCICLLKKYLKIYCTSHNSLYCLKK